MLSRFNHVNERSKFILFIFLEIISWVTNRSCSKLYLIALQKDSDKNSETFNLNLEYYSFEDISPLSSGRLRNPS
jgi:hypothetical protein